MATWNEHKRQWDETPSIAGPIELYRPTADGTEHLPADANIEVEFHDEYPDLISAIDGIDCCGRWLISTPDRGQYIGHLNSMPGSVELVTY